MTAAVQLLFRGSPPLPPWTRQVHAGILPLYATHLRLFSTSLFFLPSALCLRLPPDPFALPAAINACAALPNSLPVGRQLHAISLVAGISDDPFIATALVHMYLKCAALPDAHRVFDEMPQRSVAVWSAIIAGSAASGRVGEAFRLLDRMRSSGTRPNLITFNGLLVGLNRSGSPNKTLPLLQRIHSEGFELDSVAVSSALSASGDLEDVTAGCQIHGYASKTRLEAYASVESALLDMYGKCGRAEEMLRAFDASASPDIASRSALLAGLSRNGRVDDALAAFAGFRAQGVELNVVCWNSMVACCSQNGKDMEALQLFRQMQSAGEEPNAVTIPCLLSACGNVADLMHGKSAHCFSLRKGLIVDVYVGSSLVDMYAKCGRIADARVMFDSMPKRNVVAWNAIIGGYAMHGLANDSINMFISMKRHRQKPDTVTFICVLSACSQAGLTEEGEHFFDEMQNEHGINAAVVHYACIVSLLGRAGRLEEAYELIRKMQNEADSCVWGALLSACRVHGNLALAEVAAKRLFELEPTNAGNYALLSSIYAAKGMLGEVERVREMMYTMGIKKNPGCSWIETRNKVHMLLAGDKSHPQMSYISGKLET